MCLIEMTHSRRHQANSSTSIRAEKETARRILILKHQPLNSVRLDGFPAMGYEKVPLNTPVAEVIVIFN